MLLSATHFHTILTASDAIVETEQVRTNWFFFLRIIFYCGKDMKHKIYLTKKFLSARYC